MNVEMLKAKRASPLTCTVINLFLFTYFTWIKAMRINLCQTNRNESCSNSRLSVTELRTCGLDYHSRHWKQRPVISTLQQAVLKLLHKWVWNSEILQCTGGLIHMTNGYNYVNERHCTDIHNIIVNGCIVWLMKTHKTSNWRTCLIDRGVTSCHQVKWDPTTNHLEWKI